MKQVIINADDFGMSEAVNYGVIKAYRDGVVSSASIMINQAAAAHAILLLKEVPSLFVGLHVNLTTGSPVSSPDKVPTLVKQDGTYIGSKAFKTHTRAFSYEDAYTETKAQVERFRQLFGYYPAHLDPHSATDDNSAKALLNVAEEYGVHTGVPYKGVFTQSSEQQYRQVECPASPTGRYGEILSRGVEPEDFFKDTFSILKNRDNGKVTELHFPPGYIDQYVIAHSTLTLPRAKDLATLCSASLAGWIKDNAIKLISFGDLKR